MILVFTFELSSELTSCTDSLNLSYDGAGETSLTCLFNGESGLDLAFKFRIVKLISLCSEKLMILVVIR